MIQSDQPTIFDSGKIRAIVSSAQDGNTKPEWSPLDDTIENIGAIASHVAATIDDVVVMNVGADQGKWDEIVDVRSDQPEPQNLPSQRPSAQTVPRSAGSADVVRGDFGIRVGNDRGVRDPETRVAADVLVTKLPGIILTLPVADCSAVAIYDPVQNVIALVHLGWQSTVAELATKIVQHLQLKYGSLPSDLRIYFSPSIRKESYIFDHVAQADDPAWGPFLHRSDKGVGVDLPGYNRWRFVQTGVPIGQIQVSAVNTATSLDYYSHYRSVRSGDPEGRFALMVGLK